MTGPLLTIWGLTVEIGRHAFDHFGHYLAGRDEDQLADVNSHSEVPASVPSWPPAEARARTASPAASTSLPRGAIRSRWWASATSPSSTWRSGSDAGSSGPTDDEHIGAMDRTLTQLLESGSLDRVPGVAVGQFTDPRKRRPASGRSLTCSTIASVPLGVPVLGGLPIGHGAYPSIVPLGTTATLGTAARTLRVAPGVR